MRTKTYREIKEALATIITPLAQEMGKDAGHLLGAIGRLTEAVGSIQPAKVDLTQEMADDIVRKIHGPLTIGREFSAWITEQAHGHDVLTTFQIGYGNDAARGYMRLKADGKLNLEIMDMNGAMMWMGTFVPPGGSS